MSVFEDQMLEAINPEFPTAEKELANVKRAFDKTPTIDAYGTKLRCGKISDSYYAYGYINVLNADCAALDKNEKVVIFIQREWVDDQGETKTVDSFTFKYYRENEDAILIYNTTTETEPMPKAFNKVLSMIDIIKKG